MMAPAFAAAGATGPPRSGGRPTTGSGTRFSGAPLWRFTLRRDEQRQRFEQEMEGLTAEQQVVPAGFEPQADGWYWNSQRKIYWHGNTQKYYLYNEATSSYTELAPEVSIDKELRLASDASCSHHGVPREDRHVLIRDLAKAAQALKMPIEHFARPAALFAIYSGHRSTPSSSSSTGGKSRIETNLTGASPAGAAAPATTCAEFCARNLHLKLLPRLSEFKGPWGDEQVKEALRSSCEDLDAEFMASKVAPIGDGCSSVIALLLGGRLFVASLGDAGAMLGSADASAKVALRTEAHTLDRVSECSRISAAGGRIVPTSDGKRGRALLRVDASLEGSEAGSTSTEPAFLHVTRAFGNYRFKQASGSRTPETKIVLLATPDVEVRALHRDHLFLVLATGGIMNSLPDAEIMEIPTRRLGRPRVASGALLQAAVERGAAEGVTAICVFFEWSKDVACQEKPSSAPAVKKLKTEPAGPKGKSLQQVRCRQILVKHKDCKEPIDRVRGNKPVTRALAEAEGILREAIGAIEALPGKNVFTQRCKAVSECSTCLKGGEMAGDLGWISRGQAHPIVDAAAFALPIGHISDILESDEGLHMLWRIA
ncbi:unnamed protein product [Polarella glacialis]|uniref:Peptidylprolyl isomerase n=1 Tax=Polarella glacialis TaxID=89957 RepID=A0A813H8A3_POLGL|nr:unnamed protein product [Polarella glacialis]